MYRNEKKPIHLMEVLIFHHFTSTAKAMNRIRTQKSHKAAPQQATMSRNVVIVSILHLAVFGNGIAGGVVQSISTSTNQSLIDECGDFVSGSRATIHGDAKLVPLAFEEPFSSTGDKAEFNGTDVIDLFHIG